VTPLPSAWRDGDMAAALVPHGDASSRLADLLGCAADDVAMGRSPRGKPLLSRPAGAAYSVAHRAGMSLVAAGWDRAVGADLELVRDDLPLADIADTCFTAAEAGWLRALSDDRRPLAFTIVWAIKEAVLKSTGRGIAHGMTDPAVHGPALLPLLAGTTSLRLRLGGLDVFVRQGTIGSAHAVACIAAALPASDPSATADSRPLPDR
jgi:phosphopantetheinyl transferase